MFYFQENVRDSVKMSGWRRPTKFKYHWTRLFTNQLWLVIAIVRQSHCTLWIFKTDLYTVWFVYHIDQRLSANILKKMCRLMVVFFLTDLFSRLIFTIFVQTSPLIQWVHDKEASNCWLSNSHSHKFALYSRGFEK